MGAARRDRRLRRRRRCRPRGRRAPTDTPSDDARPTKSTGGSTMSMATNRPVSTVAPFMARRLFLRMRYWRLFTTAKTTGSCSWAAVHSACGEYMADPSPTTHSTGTPPAVGQAHAERRRHRPAEAAALAEEVAPGLGPVVEAADVAAGGDGLVDDGHVRRHRPHQGVGRGHRIHRRRAVALLGRRLERGDVRRPAGPSGLDGVGRAAASAWARTRGSSASTRQARVARHAQPHRVGAPQRGRVGGELQQLGALGQRRAVRVRVDHEGPAADEQHAVVLGELGPDARRRRQEHARPQRVRRREHPRGVQRAGVHGSAEGLGQLRPRRRRPPTRSPRRRPRWPASRRPVR